MNLSGKKRGDEAEHIIFDENDDDDVSLHFVI